jgi:hypothetical protein
MKSFYFIIRTLCCLMINRPIHCPLKSYPLRCSFHFSMLIGWHVESGDVHSSGLLPTSVVSLTAPKLCMLGYEGVHYIGGR